MAPLSRAVHLLGMGAFAVVYGLIRAALLFGVIASLGRREGLAGNLRAARDPSRASTVRASAHSGATSGPCS
jgi:hypothetical protein